MRKQLFHTSSTYVNTCNDLIDDFEAKCCTHPILIPQNHLTFTCLTCRTYFQDYQIIGQKHVKYGHIVKCDSCRNKFSKEDQLDYHLNHCYAHIKDKTKTQFKAQCYRCQTVHTLDEHVLKQPMKRQLDSETTLKQIKKQQTH